MIGLLNAYRTGPDAPAYQLEYGPMFMNFLKSLWPANELRMYEVAVSGVPRDIRECDLWIISGSPKSAYDNDPWIIELGHFVIKCAAAKQKLIGICFGHQLIAHALGGRTELAKVGWGVGTRTFRLVGDEPWMRPQLHEASLLFSHRDQVVKLPAGAGLLAQSEFCPIEMFSIGDHVFSFQGHPEFTPQFARSRLDTRRALVGETTYERGCSTMNLPTNSREVGQWMRHFATGTTP